MFLDEELEKIWNDNQSLNIGEVAKKLIDACFDRFGNPKEIGQSAWFNNIKRTELSWRLFAKKHIELDIDGIRKILSKVDEDGALFKVLNWTL